MTIFLYGPDTFRSRQKLTELKQRFIKEVDKSGLNLEVLDGENLQFPDFEKAVATLPFLAKKRMIVVENLISKNRGQKIQKEILEFLDKRELTDKMIIFWESELETKKKNSRSKTSMKRSNLLFERLKKEKYAQYFELLNFSEALKWAAEELKKRDGKIKTEPLKLLIDLVGNDLWQLNSEIDKLIAYAQERQITASDIELLVKSKIDENIFKLTDAIAQKDKVRAIKLINERLLTGIKETTILTNLIWQFKNLILLKSWFQTPKNSRSAELISRKLKLHPFVIKKTLPVLKNYDFEQLKKIYQRLLLIDYKIKTSQVEPAVLFDLLILAS